MRRSPFRAVLAGGVATLAFLTPAAPAIAQDESCIVQIEDVDVARAATPGSALEVNQDDPIVFDVVADPDIEGFTVQLEMVGVRLTLTSAFRTREGWRGGWQIQKYRWFGVGLYKMVAVEASGRCDAVAYVNVVGRSPLATALGLAGVVASVLGGLVLFLSSFVFSGERRAMAEAAWAEGGVGFRPKVSVFAILAGLLLAAGVVVLLQQFAVVYPSLLVVVAALVLGLAAGIAVPSLTRLSVVRRVNRTSM